MNSAAGTSSKRTLKSTSRRGKGLPRKVQDLSKEELLLTLQKKKECNARALKIVEGMLEPNVKEDWFLDVLQHINQNHFQDIIEERSITRLCGYPLCSNELKNIPSQQYRISTKLNKVYDIQERKNFCSNECFKASKFMKDQMHTSPLWLRDIEPSVKFALMPTSGVSGGAGDEVNVQVERVSKVEVKQLSGEDNLKSETLSERSIADIFNDLHIVTSLRENASSNLNEDFSHTDSRKVETSDGITEVTVQEGGSISDTKETPFEKDTGISSTFEYLEIGKSLKNSGYGLDDTAPSLKEEFPDVHKYAKRKWDSDQSMDNSAASEEQERKKVFQEHNLISKGITDENSSQPMLIESPLSLSGKDREKTKASNTVTCHAVNADVQQEVHINSDLNETGSHVNADGMKQLIEEPLNFLRNVESAANASNSASAECDINQTLATGKNHKKEHKKIQRNTQSHLTSPRSFPIVSHVEKCVEEWFTMETMCFLFGESALRDMLEQKGESIQAHYKALRTATWDQEKHERFLAICKRLSLLELEDSNFDNQVVKSDGEAIRKPLPDYDALKREAETMELKIKAFYQGNIEIDDRKVSFSENTKNASEDSDKIIDSQIPLVHLHSQRALRKKIVLDGLNRVLPDFLRTFGMRPCELTGSIRGLIGTFALSATNITFRPQELSLLGLIVIKLLSLRESKLKQHLQREQSNTYLTLMLMSFKQEPGYLDHLLSWLTDVDKLLARPQPTEKM